MHNFYSKAHVWVSLPLHMAGNALVKPYGALFAGCTWCEHWEYIALVLSVQGQNPRSLQSMKAATCVQACLMTGQGARVCRDTSQVSLVSMILSG